MALICASVIALGCNLTRLTDSVTLPPPVTPIVMSDWRLIAQGIERRDYDAPLGDGQEARVILLRFDPALVTFKVHYRPGDPLTISGWRDALPQATVIVNSSFFDETDRALGLVISDEQVYGQSFVGFGGMFQVDTNGGARVRSLVGEPYQGGLLLQAAQGFPMLIEAGGVLAPQGDGFDQRSYRTMLAQDVWGRILIAVIPYNRVSLAAMQNWLINSDLNIDMAFGLDGGRSTGLSVSIPGHNETYPSLDQVPSVIAVYLR
jgi:hypothetical protein